MAKPKVIRIECVAPNTYLQRYRVKFDMEWTNPHWDGEYSAKGLWFDEITCVASDELGAWQMGEKHIKSRKVEWRDKSGEG